MPGRKFPLITNQIYHVFNRGVAHQPIFIDKRDYFRAVDSMAYYQNSKPSLKYAKFLKLPTQDREKFLEQLQNSNDKLVENICYCFMPNHFHFLIKQLIDGGISKFLSNFTNSYTRYFNIKNQRDGSLFSGKFKSVRIETDEQLLHTSRYIHLNPYTSYVVKRIENLETYPYSSFPEYLKESSFTGLCNRDVIISNFSKKKSYKDFVFDNSDYQRKLDEIKHLIFE